MQCITYFLAGYLYYQSRMCHHVAEWLYPTFHSQPISVMKTLKARNGPSAKWSMSLLYFTSYSQYCLSYLLRTKRRGGLVLFQVGAHNKLPTAWTYMQFLVKIDQFSEFRRDCDEEPLFSFANHLIDSVQLKMHIFIKLSLLLFTEGTFAS